MAEISDKLYRNSLIFSQRDLHGVEVVPHIGVFCTTGKNMLANTATGGGVWGWWREELEAAERSFHVFLHIQDLRLLISLVILHVSVLMYNSFLEEFPEFLSERTPSILDVTCRLSNSCFVNSTPAD